MGEQGNSSSIAPQDARDAKPRLDVERAFQTRAVCKGSWSLGNNCRQCARCLEAAPVEIERLQQEVKAVQRDRDMYVNAWRRELGNKLFPKMHLIDALVKTTRHLQENYARWEAETKAYQERERNRATARALGIDPDMYPSPTPTGREA